MRKTIAIFALIFMIISCKETRKETSIDKSVLDKSEIAASYKSIEVEIEGMTCEIGCARTIQSKLSKMDGVTYSNVNFEAEKGQFTYDENKISKEEIVHKIDGIGGGDLYKVTKTTEIEDIIKKTD